MGVWAVDVAGDDKRSGAYCVFIEAGLWYKFKVFFGTELNICEKSSLRSNFSVKPANGCLKMKYLVDSYIFLEVMLNQQYAAG